MSILYDARSQVLHFCRSMTFEVTNDLKKLNQAVLYRQFSMTFAVILKRNKDNSFKESRSGKKSLSHKVGSCTGGGTKNIITKSQFHQMLLNITIIQQRETFRFVVAQTV